MERRKSIRYCFDGPIPKTRFTQSQILRLLAIAKTLVQPNPPDNMEKMGFDIISRMVLNILIQGSDRVSDRSQRQAAARRAVPRGQDPSIG